MNGEGFEWFKEPNNKIGDKVRQLMVMFQSDKTQKSLKEAGKSPDSKSRVGRLSKNREMRHYQSHKFRGLQLGRRQGGR
jgi:hypothetical protein